jgi:hypothetical protein
MAACMVFLSAISKLQQQNVYPTADISSVLKIAILWKKQIFFAL